MDSILNEITYSDGRMDMQKTRIVDTPAKLKLRAKTFEGINRSLQARRGPVVQESRFNIPSAFMAMDVPAGGDSSTGSNFTLVDAKLVNQEVVPLESQTPKRLKVKASQRDIFKGKGESVMQDFPPVSEEKEDVKAEVEVTPVVDKEVAPSVSDSVPVVAEEPVIAPPQPEISPAAPVDQIDAVRDKAFNGPVAAVEPTPVEQAMETDSFTRLDAVTKEYVQLTEEERQVEEQLEKGQRGLEEIENQYEEFGRELKRKQTTIDERMEAIGAHKKETEEIKRKTAELERKIEQKIVYVEELKKKRSAEKSKKEKRVRQIESETHNYQKKIDERKSEIEALEVQNKTLEVEESDALKTRNEAQQVYDTKLNLFKAITIPEEDVSVEQSLAEGDIPLPTVIDFPVDDDFERSYEESSKVKSLGRAA